jgi:hypothetical protein
MRLSGSSLRGETLNAAPAANQVPREQQTLTARQHDGGRIVPIILYDKGTKVLANRCRYRSE